MPIPRSPGRTRRAAWRSLKPGLSRGGFVFFPRQRRYHTRAKDGILYSKRRFSSRFIEKVIYSGTAAEKLMVGKKRIK
jgi:hypothetical protein